MTSEWPRKRRGGNAASTPAKLGDGPDLLAFRTLPVLKDPALEQPPFRNPPVALADLNWRLLTGDPGTSPHDPCAGLFGHVAPGDDLLARMRALAERDPAQFAPLLGAMRAVAAGERAESIHLYTAPDGGEERQQLCLGRLEIAGVPYLKLTWLPATEIFALRKERQRLGRLLMRSQADLIRAQEQERQRVARDLHDNAAQYLAALSLSIARLQSINKDPAVAAVAAELSEFLANYHRVVRGMTYALHPPDLQQHGLNAAVHGLCDGLTRRSNLAVALQIYGLDRRRGTAVESAVFRLVQEALSNVQAHAGAGRVRVRARRSRVLPARGRPGRWQRAAVGLAGSPVHRGGYSRHGPPDHGTGRHDPHPCKALWHRYHRSCCDTAQWRAGFRLCGGELPGVNRSEEPTGRQA
ncbi:histidine kinase [Sphingomonas sp. MJ1 (PH-R8)]|uniref:sensor histidine kinase n=1 Tax=Sphingomonas sp. MJ1 (PH-R8) TaxID=3112950 RepID=UPI003A86C1BE